MEYPKIILMGGAPCIGKSTVSRLIASRLNYACLSTDDLLSAITSVTSPESHPSLHMMTGWTMQEYYVHHTVDELIMHAKERYSTFRTAIESVIKLHVSRESPIVIEGWGLWPEEIHEVNLTNEGMIWLVADEHLLTSRTRGIKPLYEGASDEEKMIENYVGRSVWHNSQIIEAVDRLEISSIRVLEEYSADGLCDKILHIIKLDD